MHIGKQLAKLNPKNCRFDIGSGGIPDLMPTDIAAALGMVDPGIGREVLCRVWWPAGAKMTEVQLREEVDAKIRAEWARRESAMLDGLLAIATRGSRGRSTYAAAHEQRWPRLVVRDKELPRLADGFQKVRAGVLKEIADAGLCPDCSGRGVVTNDVRLSVTCRTCKGEGHHRLSERGRASACGFSWEVFRDNWQTVYDWTFQQCMDELHQAERQFIHALS